MLQGAYRNSSAMEFHVICYTYGLSVIAKLSLIPY